MTIGIFSAFFFNFAHDFCLQGSCYGSRKIIYMECLTYRISIIRNFSYEVKIVPNFLLRFYYPTHPKCNIRDSGIYFFVVNLVDCYITLPITFNFLCSVVFKVDEWKEFDCGHGHFFLLSLLEFRSTSISNWQKTINCTLRYTSRP